MSLFCLLRGTLCKCLTVKWILFSSFHRVWVCIRQDRGQSSFYPWVYRFLGYCSGKESKILLRSAPESLERIFSSAKDQMDRWFTLFMTYSSSPDHSRPQSDASSSHNSLLHCSSHPFPCWRHTLAIISVWDRYCMSSSKPIIQLHSSWNEDNWDAVYVCQSNLASKQKRKE